MSTTHMVKLYPLLIVLCVILLQGCSLRKEHKIILDQQHHTWSREFKALGVPISGESLHVKLNGTIEGEAQIFAYISSDRTGLIKKQLIGPGEFTFFIEALEYWGQRVFIEYIPKKGAVVSMSGSVIFDGTTND